jgi:D-alanyl-D-alanine carboxypeptidase
MSNQKKKNSSKGTYRYKKGGKTYNIRIDRIIATLVILIVVIVLLCSCFKSCGKSKTKTETKDDVKTVETTGNEVESQQEESTDVQTAAMRQVTMSADDVYNGDLILIDGSHPYKFNDDDLNLTTVSSLKNDDYTVADLEVSLDSDTIEHFNTFMEDFNEATSLSNNIRIISAYRTYDEQEAKYSQGSASTMAGYSEYHSGRTFQLGIFPDGEGSNFYSPDGDYAWIEENACNYGFIERYPEGKEDYTGESEIPYIYRYVGIAHATYMYENNLCLEEYISAIKSYSSSSPLLVSTADGTYAVYYVAASETGSTSVEVPENSDYTISGNNSDGFIVSVAQ